MAFLSTLELFRIPHKTHAIATVLLSFLQSRRNNIAASDWIQQNDTISKLYPLFDENKPTLNYMLLASSNLVLLARDQLSIRFFFSKFWFLFDLYTWSKIVDFVQIPMIRHNLISIFSTHSVNTVCIKKFLSEMRICSLVPIHYWQWILVRITLHYILHTCM